MSTVPVGRRYTSAVPFAGPIASLKVVDAVMAFARLEFRHCQHRAADWLLLFWPIQEVSDLDPRPDGQIGLLAGALSLVPSRSTSIEVDQLHPYQSGVIWGELGRRGRLYLIIGEPSP